MQKIILYISIALVTLVNTVSAQEKTFEQKAKEIAVNIKTIAEEEKKALKAEIEAIDKAVESGQMTATDAEKAKTKVAEERAKNIETRTAEYEVALRELITNQVQNIDTDTTNTVNNINVKFKGKKNDPNKSENRTTSQFVFATGYNNLVTDGAVANSEFGYARSTFYEWGLTYNTRLSKNSNLLHFKYGVGFMYNMLHATENRIFSEIGDKTILVDAGVDTKASKTYFKNVYFVVPMHLEFDFSKTQTVDDKKIFKSHKGARFGIGGFVGVNTNSKQFIRYNQDGHKISVRDKGDFNVNDFTYGLSTYIGYKQTSLYLKYDLNPMFKNNAIDQNNISLGIRFDWN